MLFSLLQLSWPINIQKNEVIFYQDFFFVVDKYVRQLRPTDRLSHDNLL